jgi:hypothetical protein
MRTFRAEPLLKGFLLRLRDRRGACVREKTANLIVRSLPGTRVGESPGGRPDGMNNAGEKVRQPTPARWLDGGRSDLLSGPENLDGPAPPPCGYAPTSIRRMTDLNLRAIMYLSGDSRAFG